MPNSLNLGVGLAYFHYFRAYHLKTFMKVNPPKLIHWMSSFWLFYYYTSLLWHKGWRYCKDHAVDNIRFLLLLVFFYIFYIIFPSEAFCFYQILNVIHRKKRTWKRNHENFNGHLWTMSLILNPVKIVYKKVHTFCFVLCIVVARNMKERDAV